VCGAVRAHSWPGKDVRYLKLGPRACVWCHQSVSRASAAGVKWSCRTTSAPWNARYDHTSVIDAAGAIYVLGGTGYGHTTAYTTYQDVWASTDGGARAGLAPGLLVGY
jgi:hypothetical protein